MRFPLMAVVSKLLHSNGVARPCEVMRLSTNVEWPSRSKSVQSIATQISGRAATRYGTHLEASAKTSMASLPTSLSTCFTACFFFEPLASERPAPMMLMPSDAVRMTPAAALLSDSMRF